MPRSPDFETASFVLPKIMTARIRQVARDENVSASSVARTIMHAGFAAFERAGGPISPDACRHPAARRYPRKRSSLFQPRPE